MKWEEGFETKGGGLEGDSVAEREVVVWKSD